MISHRRRFNDLLNRAAKSKTATSAKGSMARKPRGADMDAVEAADEHGHVGAEKTASKTSESLD